MRAAVEFAIGRDFTIVLQLEALGLADQIKFGEETGVDKVHLQLPVFQLGGHCNARRFVGDDRLRLRQGGELFSAAMEACEVGSQTLSLLRMTA